jgi:hypothetical protein
VRLQLEYDEEWLAIVRAFDSLTPRSYHASSYDPEEAQR